MFVVTDVHYPPYGGAQAALVAADDSAFSSITLEKVVCVAEVAPYEPGKFFKRELPPLRVVLAGVSGIEILIIDGYVDLDPEGKPGLGAHTHAEFDIPVIGVAKTRFATATHAVPVIRGKASRPLYVTAVGVSLDTSAAIIRSMSGAYRTPDALRRVDALARGNATPDKGNYPPKDRRLF